MNETSVATQTALVLIGVPIGLFAAYVSWQIVPVIIENVIPIVVQTVMETIVR